MNGLVRLANAAQQWFYRLATPVVRTLVHGLARIMGRGRYRRP